MAILIGIGLSGLSAKGGTQVPVAPAPLASVAPLAVANAVFDSGAARGSNAADIPLTGTTDAPDGAQIEARIVRADTGAEVHPWAAVATASGGTWSGSFPAAQRSAHRLRAQVRVQGSAAVGAMAGDFMVGHVVVLVGQSEEHRMFMPGFDRPEQGPYPTLDPAAEDSFFNLPIPANIGAGTLQIGAVNTARPLTRGFLHLANTFTRNAPGEKILFIDAVISGTSYAQMAKDSDPARNWNTSFADSVQYVKDYGSDVGVMMSTWTAAPAKGSDNYRRYLYPLHTGQYAPEDGGGPYTLGTEIVVNGSAVSGRSYDHLFWDFTGAGRGVFDTAKTRLFFYGPHRFEDFNGLQQPQLQIIKQATRASIRNWVDDPEMVPVMVPKGPEMIAYQKGTAVTAGGVSVTTTDPNAVDWDDWAHPGDFDPDGIPGRARHTAIAMLYALDVGPAAARNDVVPKLNRADWQTTHVDLWYEAPDGSTPPITTTRLARGLAPIPDTHPHRTEVAGFYISGQPAQRAEIVAGRIRVYPDGIKAAFDGTDEVQYGLGGASANVVAPDDNLDEIWKNQPICVVPGFDYTVPGFDGIAVEPMPLAADIANTLATVETITLGATENVWLGDAAGVMQGTETGMTYQYRIRLGGSNLSQSLSRQHVKFDYLLSQSRFTFAIQDSSGSDIAAFGLPNGAFPGGQFGVITISTDLTAGTTTVWVGEVGSGTRYDFTHATGTGVFGATGVSLTTGNDNTGEIVHAAYWRSAIPNPASLAVQPDLGAYPGLTWVPGADAIGEPQAFFRSDGAGGVTKLGLTVGTPSAPTLSGPAASDAGSAQIAWGITSDSTLGTIHAAARLSTDAVLSASDIITGTGNAVATGTDTSPTADGNNGGTITGLVGGTTYVVDMVQDAGSGILSAVASSGAVTVTSGVLAPFDPASLLATATDGFVFDVSDGSTVWQDAAGTVPAGVGDSVARIDDASGNGRHAILTSGATAPVLAQDGAGRPYLVMGTNTAFTISGVTPASDRAQVFVAMTNEDPSQAGIMFEGDGSFTTTPNVFQFGPRPNNTWALGVSQNVANRYVAYSSGSFGSDRLFALAASINAGTSVQDDVVEVYRINGVDAKVTDNSNFLGSAPGNFAAGPIYLGARGGSALFTTTHFYGAILRFGSALSVTDFNRAEQWAGEKVGTISP